MKLTKQSKTKLDLIRIEGLCKLILNKYDEDDVISKISNITKSIPKDIKAIYKLSRAQLTIMIESSNITNEEIDECYEEYRYGLKPGFSIFSFKSNKKLSTRQVCTKIQEKLKEILNSEDEQPVIKNIIYNNSENFKEENLTEYSFYYLKKYSYINEKEEPTYIYELKENFAWISVEDSFVAIKNCDERVIRKLRTVISQIYEAELYPIILTKELVKKIFGDRRKKVSGVNLNANEKEAEKIMISDSKLDEKEELKKQLEPYTTTSETLEINVEDVINTLGINNSKGKIHLTKNMAATSFRKWSITTIREIIKYVSSNETEFEIFKAKNIMSNEKWTNYTLEQKKIIEEIIFKIICFSKNKYRYNSIMQIKVEHSKVSKYFMNKIFIECSECNDSYCVPKCHCGSYDIKLTTRGTIICSNCGEEKSILECEEGHQIYIKDLTNTNIYLIPNSQLYREIINFLKEEFNIEFKGCFYITNNNMQILEKTEGYLLKTSEIKEFDDVLKTVVDTKEKDELRKCLKNVKEKCLEPTKEKCNNCEYNKKNMCILKLFTTYEGYRPEPHHGHEFGDINFKVNYKNEELQFVGIAKSSCNLTRASKEAREMIQQILIATQDSHRIGIIGAICPTKFDTQFERDIEYIAKCTESKIVILDDIFMMRELKYYNTINE